MKRSQMIYTISDAIAQFIPDTPLNMRNLIADCALTEAEKYGMQPPNISLEEMFPNSGLKDKNAYYYACWENENNTLTSKRIIEATDKLKNENEILLNAVIEASAFRNTDDVNGIAGEICYDALKKIDRI